MIIDIKAFTEFKEELNGIYSESLRNKGFKMDEIELFFKCVNDFFTNHNQYQSGLDEQAKSQYKKILEDTYSETIRIRRNAISSWNKKLVAKRGNVIWDSSKGPYKRG
jgi:hypothetical protein